MRAGVVFSILAISVLCTVCTHARGYSAKSIHDAITCAKNLGFSKCITAYGIWKAESALEPLDGRAFNWRQFANTSDEELYSKLCDDTEKILRYRSLVMGIGEDYAIQMKSTENATLKFDVIQSKSDVATGRTSMKKMTKMFYQALPFLIFPGLIMSAVLPFFLPTLKMATLATGMLNNMALAGAVFTLLRNNAFNDKKYAKRVIYVNAGYDTNKFSPLAEGTSDDIVATEYATQYSNEVTHDVKDYHLIGLDPNTGISYPFNADWLKNTNNEVGKVKNVQIIGEVPSVNDWTKPNLPIKWRKHSNR